MVKMNNLFDDMLKRGLISCSNSWIERVVEAKNPKLTVYLANSRVYYLDRLDRIITQSPVRQG